MPETSFPVRSPRRSWLGLACALFCGIGLGCTEKVWLPASLQAGSGTGGTGDGPGGGGKFDGGVGDAAASSQGGRGGPGTPDGGGRGSFTCNQQPLPVSFQHAEILFAVAKNASMANTKFGIDGDTRLGAVRSQLLALMQANQNAVNFGYLDFPAADVCAAGDGCCVGRARTAPSPTTASAISMALQCAPPQMTNGCGVTSDSRPISAALGVAVSLFGTANNMSDRYLVLMVDGDPSCDVDPNRSCDAAKGQWSQLGTMGVKTFVVAVGQEAQAAHCLSDLATDAATPAVAATDPGTLMTGLAGIVKQAAAPYCSFTLKAPADRTSVELYVNNQKISRGGMNGWDFIQNLPGPILRIEVRGDACTRLQATPDAQVQVVGCSSAM